MSGDDEIERVLREVDAMNSSKAKPPARRAEPAATCSTVLASSQ